MTSNPSRWQSLLSELKRRKVVRVAAIYAATGFVVLQAAQLLATGLGLPAWLFPVVTVLTVLGLPLALVVAWAFELTPEGVVRETSAPAGEAAVGERWFSAASLGAIGGLLVVALGTGWILGARTAGEPAAGPGGEPGAPAIVVLPFADLSEAGDQAYFADGVAEEVLDLLSRVEGLRVISRSSAFALRDADLDVRTIAERLGVNHVLEGSLRRSGARIRVAAQLIDAPTDTRLWSQTFDRDAADIFQVQEEIASAIVSELEGRLGVRVGSAEARPLTQDLEAYELYLRARERYFRRGRENLLEAAELLEAAVARDPRFSEAMATLAAVHALQPGFPEGSARSWARRALELDDRNADAWAALGLIAQRDGDLILAEERFRRALREGPTNVNALLWHGIMLLNTGHVDRAERNFRALVTSDPITGINHGWLGSAYLARGDLESAERAYERAEEFGWWVATRLRAMVALERGDWETGADLLTRDASEATGSAGWSRATVETLVDGVAGRAPLEPVRAAAREIADAEGGFPGFRTRILFLVGDIDGAVAAAEQALAGEEGLRMSVFEFLRTGRDALRLHPAFPELVRASGILRYWQEFGWPAVCRPLEGDDFVCEAWGSQSEGGAQR